MEHIGFATALAMRRLREHDRQVSMRKDTEEPRAARSCSVVSCVEQTVVEAVASLAYVCHPLHIEPSFVAADRLALFVEVAPTHELFHVLNIDVVRL